ncbi:tigger transposable element-derived protein 1 [Nephila pilipes]|uniref:Tigger transposable element-derived protein 1 n=1 Tax=Nephila pilipes TaxID=299642 RepID=A0A8X6T0I3_NEPPI|nr:tigger transposable element-derived protein 1 [Nephila pilipes]GFT43508.1 tigger transposable element-derived protein 1 [Nephila pilipes]
MDRKKVCEKSSAKKKLVEEHTQELTTEEIQELQSQQHTEIMQEIGFEESEEEVISISEIKEILGMWERVSQLVEKKHPEKVTIGRASDLFNDTCLTHFRNILRGRKKQTSLDMFFFLNGLQVKARKM